MRPVALPLFLLLAFLLAACSSSRPAEPELLPCYRPKSWKEYDRLSFERIQHPGKPFLVKGKPYACLEKVEAEESACYRAKDRKEFEKLSRQQERHPERPLRIKGRNYRCLQRSE